MNVFNPSNGALHRMSDSFPGMQHDGNSLCSFAFLAPLLSKVKDTSTGLLEWLRNTSWEKGLATLGRSAISAAGVLKLVFEAVVELNREVLPIVAAWLWRVEDTVVVRYIRENREWTMIASALFYFFPHWGLIFSFPGTALFILGFEDLGIRAGSPAAAYQRDVYGGFTPSGSWFSKLQSVGMKIYRYPFLLGVIKLSAALVFVFAWRLE